MSGLKGTICKAIRPTPIIILSLEDRTFIGKLAFSLTEKNIENGGFRLFAWANQIIGFYRSRR